MKRLSSEGIVNLRVGDDVTIVIPPDKRGEPKHAKHRRSSVYALFKRVIMSNYSRSLGIDRGQYWHDELEQREIIRDDKKCHEFHVTISSYAERSRAIEKDLPQGYIDYWMGTGGAGLVVRLHGSTTAFAPLIKFNVLPFLEVHQTRNTETTAESFLDESIDFTTLKKEGDLAPYLMEQLDATRGDPIAYLEVMMKYYQQALAITKLEVKKKAPAKGTSTKDGSVSMPVSGDDDDAVLFKFRQAIKREMQPSKLQQFADYVDKQYAEALEECYGFSEVKGVPYVLN